MKVTKKYNVYANDFDAELTCEHCGSKQEYHSGYNDFYWWNHVITKVRCAACGKNTNDPQSENAA